MPQLLFAQQSSGDEGLSALLGGLVQSDRWIIRKDKNEEEFIGNVRYENDIYKIDAHRALSNRKERTYTIEGNIRALRSDKKTGERAELKAQKVFYNKPLDFGYAVAAQKKQISIFYDTADNKYKLYGNKLDFSDKFTNFKIIGNAKLHNIDNKLYAQEIVFNTQNGILRASGGRPVLNGSNEDADYAVQADIITAQTQENKYKAQGKVQGWITSKKEINTKF
jgi:lipopolysaccharide export system protein LptA